MNERCAICPKRGHRLGEIGSTADISLELDEQFFEGHHAPLADNAEEQEDLLEIVKRMSGNTVTPAKLPQALEEMRLIMKCFNMRHGPNPECPRAK